VIVIDSVIDYSHLKESEESKKKTVKMSYTPISYSDVDITKLELVKPKKEMNSINGRMFFIQHNKVPLRIVLPELMVPYGAAASEKYPDKYQMVVSFEGANDDNPRGCRLGEALKKMTAINDRIAELVMENKEDLFKDKKKVSNEIISSRYRHFIGHNDDPRPEKLSLVFQKHKTISERDNSRFTEDQKLRYLKQFRSLGEEYGFLITADGKHIDVDIDNLSSVIPRGSRVKPVIEFAYLWVQGTSQECYPVWVFVHGLLVEASRSNFFDIRKIDEDNVIQKSNESEDCFFEEDKCIV
jgi:hypothetical protein